MHAQPAHERGAGASCVPQHQGGQGSSSEPSPSAQGHGAAPTQNTLLPSRGAAGTCTWAPSIPPSIPAERRNERIVQHRENKHQGQTFPPQPSPSLSTNRFHEMLQSACHQNKQALKPEPEPTGFMAVRIHCCPSVTHHDNTLHSGSILDQKVKEPKADPQPEWENIAAVKSIELKHWTGGKSGHSKATAE